MLQARDVDGVPMQDIAGRLGIPLQTAYTRLRSARRNFSRLLRRRSVVADAQPALAVTIRRNEETPGPRRRRRPRSATSASCSTPTGATWCSGCTTASPRNTPLRSASWCALGVYDSTTIFRIEPGFVAQVTNAQNRQKALSKEQHQAITAIPAEFSKLKHRPGLLSMARDDDDVNSAETSFSFMLGRAPELDGKYTIIGEVVWGQPLLAMIAKDPTDGRKRPFTPDRDREGRGEDRAGYSRDAGGRELAGADPVATAAPTPAPAAAPEIRLGRGAV